MKVPDLAWLKEADLRELESIYEARLPVAVPTGCYRGCYLRSLESTGARRPFNRAFSLLGFAVIPFGVDFESRCWYFGHRALQAGRFSPEIAASRWRRSSVVSLRYDESRLPYLVRRHLYDEIKPLDEDLCLGIGGLNRDRGEGELFFFALAKYS